MSHNLTYKKFGDVASFSRGLTFAKGDVAIGSSKKVLRSNNIDLQTHTLNFDDVACLKEEFIIPNEKKLHKGDIFICMSNGSTQHLGKVAFIDKDMDYAFGGFMGVIHPDNTTVYPKYAFYACLSSEYRRFLASIFNGININNLKWSDLSNLQIPIPALQEQERIVAELDLLEGIIDKQKQQLKELDTLAQSIFYDMFGNPVENEKGWIVRKLGDVCGFVNGFAFKSEKFKKEGLPVLRISNIQNDIVKEDDMVYFSPSDYKEDFSKYQVVKGDIVIAMSGATTGKLGVHIGSSTYYLNQRVGKFLPSKTTLNKSYLLYYLKSMSAQILNDAMGVAQPNISSGQIKGYDILVPPMDAQISFATIINTIASQKQSINRSIAESQKLFDYTMDKYFG